MTGKAMAHRSSEQLAMKKMGEGTRHFACSGVRSESRVHLPGLYEV
jgi:hypothetical protein